MTNQIAFLIFELKGMIDTIEEMASIDEQWNYPCIERLQKKVNELVELVKG
ncbi:hypothetical protein [Anoxybacillus flavithermus]|nr:hypothetical protein [Anoxybacillus flavithermus]